VVGSANHNSGVYIYRFLRDIIWADVAAVYKWSGFSKNSDGYRFQRLLCYSRGLKKSVNHWNTIFYIEYRGLSKFSKQIICEWMSFAPLFLMIMVDYVWLLLFESGRCHHSCHAHLHYPVCIAAAVICFRYHESGDGCSGAFLTVYLVEQPLSILLVLYTKKQIPCI
jgi:hypothetical protein